MKIIDLLNKIANGEENIRVKHKIFELDYINMENMNVCYPENIKSFSLMTLIKSLNDEIEIIEEDKKIEKLEEKYYHNEPAIIDDMAHKINEIIDVINRGD